METAFVNININLQPLQSQFPVSEEAGSSKTCHLFFIFLEVNVSCLPPPYLKHCHLFLYPSDPPKSTKPGLVPFVIQPGTQERSSNSSVEQLVAGNHLLCDRLCVVPALTKQS